MSVSICSNRTSVLSGDACIVHDHLSVSSFPLSVLSCRHVRGPCYDRVRTFLPADLGRTSGPSETADGPEEEEDHPLRPDRGQRTDRTPARRSGAALGPHSQRALMARAPGSSGSAQSICTIRHRATTAGPDDANV